MKSTRNQRFILYSLGKWFEEANNQIRNRPLKVSISKALFIELALKSGIAKKQKRALYKNLEVLEKKKLITYRYRELELTKKGEKLYKEIKRHMDPYILIYQKLKEKSPTSYTRKVQTVFK
ncbi:hypothetical protein GF323_00835 [Candidatus Woesearchaeota archaeon]|nr:hypothetical protein [Candidatus Woesearchaeota archaeon]